MSTLRSRRTFLADVGRGMVVAAIGSHTAADMGLAATESAGAGDEVGLSFGALEPLVDAMQETPLDKLLPYLVARLRSGTELRELVGAAALANARAFGGEDYVGYHTMMALAPAYEMALEMPEASRALPVLKVLYRNTSRLHESGARPPGVLRPVEPAVLAEGARNSATLREAVHAEDMERAERTFAALASGSAAEAFDHLLHTVEDATDVHRVVLPYRAWCLVDLVGEAHAHTLLRQSVRYCVRGERWASRGAMATPRTLLPRLFDEHRLEGRKPGARRADDAWVEELARTVFNASAEDAAGAVAAALTEGMSPDDVGEAISLAANQLVLRDHGRRPREEQPGKPIGSVHGDSIGVHACDSANAWRNMARVASAHHTFACLILGAYQVAFDRVNRGGDFVEWEPLPLPYHASRVSATEPAALLAEAESAIRQNLQAHAAAVVARYGELGHAPGPVFDLMRRYATSEDGALHAEKYYRTASEEFQKTRAAFRWRQLVALARVTASEYGRPAPGYEEARELLARA